jgi:hypothetical protein
MILVAIRGEYEREAFRGAMREGDETHRREV